MGGSTSVLKNNKHTINQVKPDKDRDEDKPRPDTVKCRKHFSNDVTHICEKTEELICLNCYQRQKRLKENGKGCFEIEEYMKSLKYKQTETRAIDQLRNRKTILEEELKLLDFHEKRASSKRREMLEEVNTFVGTLVELVKHMGEDLCSEVRQTLDEYTVRINNQREHLQTWYKELLTIQTDVNRRKDKTENKAMHLRSVLDCKAFVTSVKANVQKSKDNSDFKLKLNKLMTLGEIVGKNDTSGNATLGEVFRESERRESVRDVLSTISEIETDVNSLNSETIEGMPERGPSPSIDDDWFDTQNERDKDNDIDYRKHGHSTETNHVTAQNSGTVINKISHDEFVRASQPAQNMKLRNQFEKDKYLAGSVQSSSSPVKSRFSRMTTPRNSTGSILSPVSITTPSRIQLLPTRQARKSVNEKSAVKTNTIKLISDIEGGTPNFTDSVILDNGKIVLCDQANEKLVLLNSKFMQIDAIKLRGPPHNIAKTDNDDKTLAVTVPDKSLIQFIWVVGEKLEEPNKAITSKPKCRGLAYIDNNLMYTSRNDVVVVKQDDNSKPWKFDCAFREPVSLNADRGNKALYVCCIGLKSYGEVIKINVEKEKIEQVLCFGDIKHPVCCSRDSDDNVYICDINPPRIHLVSSAGTYCRVVLDENEGSIQHVNFFHGRDTFLTTVNNSNEVRVYELR